MAQLPKLSISAKLYAIFALLATATVVLALLAGLSARRHAALTDDFDAAFQGAHNVEQIKGLIYAAVMESRGVDMSEDAAARKTYADGLVAFTHRIASVINSWQGRVRPEDAAQFEPFVGRVEQFIQFRKELARRGVEVEVGQAAGRE